MFGRKKQESKHQVGPDFSAVDTRTKAEEWVRRGDLVKLLLLPVEFGGLDDPRNTVFVPAAIVGIKAGIDQNIIIPLAAEGKLTEYA
jgi:hypothetical protein